MYWNAHHGERKSLKHRDGHKDQRYGDAYGDNHDLTTIIAKTRMMTSTESGKTSLHETLVVSLGVLE